MKTLYELAQAMRDRMESLGTIENIQKELAACQAQLIDRDKEIRDLHQHVRIEKKLQEELKNYQEQLRQLTAENNQQKEKLMLQKEELDRQKVVMDQLNFKKQPIIDPTTTSPGESMVSPFPTRVELWKWESKSQVHNGLYQTYERQRDLLFLAQGLTQGSWIDHGQFLQLWQ